MKKCPVHNAKLVYRQTTYGGRWHCAVEGCTVVCWGGDTSTPADKPTRDARHALHQAFDPLWHDAAGRFSQGHRPNKPGVRRSRAYRWLSEKLSIPFNQTHFGMFTLEQCQEAMRHVESISSCAAEST